MTRRGLVLGAGGFLGAAWMLGALLAVEDATGWDPRDADVMVGTSAGAVLAALLRAGRSPAELYREHRGDTASARGMDLPEPPPPTVAFDLDGEPVLPGLRRLGLGSPRLAARALRAPWRLPPGAVCAALLPRGRRSLRGLRGLVDGAHPGGRWPDGTWIAAMNYHTGARVGFGRPEAPRVSLARAVTASCAVPAWYAPVPIRGVPYVDGGVCSPFNADLLDDAGLDEVLVLAPLGAFELDRPRAPLAWLERRWRRAVTNRLRREVAALRAAGAGVRVLTPNAADLGVMGANMMDGARRRDVLRSARTSVLARFAAARPASMAT
ncbi:patatin-like phospholipase family protein [Pseudonocardia acaciae]|uniref:patatin-like phospholipase family protein n=1 Tax=Pseudonocardia acaciae TaxID=551276 RepID=UPI000685A86F|nr:patatin-like phospholipase family protein [Pseudonocardia acaciae]